MTDAAPAELTPLQSALLALTRMRSRVERLEGAAREPVAVVGVGCRLPGGADDAESFWSLLRDGRDAVTEVPAERWDVDAYYDPDPAAPGKTSTRWGGFLSGVDLFDAAFFGIAPREAVAMDPQQRLLLEVAWEALEDAGLPPDRLQGSRTGVFVGISTGDYLQLQLRADRGGQVDAYTGTGSAFSVAAGRLAYTLGLQGPALAVDTACSSSLVAAHLACQSLRAGECNAALVGGVNLMLTPEATINFSKARMMAADGRCKTFDAAADGYVRGEGCGVLVLKRLSDAERDGDRVRAVIRGSAVNQDGRSNGLTSPNVAAQEALIREALGRAGVKAEAVGYVEAHGTGTALGDPIELRALGRALGDGRRPDEPVVVGSVKTNLGHLEAAAGIAGLLKAVLVLDRGEIPPHLHFATPTPHVDWAALPLVVARRARPWPRGGAPRVAGVSSFGFSGTNAHLVLEEAPPVEPPVTEVERPLHLLGLSARDPRSLAALAGRMADRLAGDGAGDALADVVFSSNTGRAAHRCRLAVAAGSAAEMADRLRAAARGEEGAGTARGERPESGAPPVVFLFSGQGSQHAGMGRLLYATQPTFRRALERCDEVLRPHLGRPLPSLLYEEPEEGSPLHRTASAQPALFAVEYALLELWRSWGVEPDVVLGHSLGELTAAFAAGVLGLEDALALVAERGRLMEAAPGDGAMAAVSIGEREALEAAAEAGGRVSVAAVNAPGETVLSGDAAALDATLERLRRAQVRCRRLTVSHAFHSAQMEPILDDLEAVAARLLHRPARLEMISNLSGEPLGGDVDWPRHWRLHARHPVRFADGIDRLLRRGFRHFVEVGPAPVLLAMARGADAGGEARWLPSLRRGRDDWRQMTDSLGALYAAGVSVDWRGFDRDYPRRRVTVPTYPFQRRRFWIDGGAAPPPAAAGAATGDDAAAARDAEARRFLDRLAAAPGGERRPMLTAFLQQQVAGVLGLSESPDPALGFFEQGMDSLMAVELKARLDRAVGRTLPTSVAFDHPTIDRLAAHLLRELGFDASPAAAVVVPRRGAADEPIAVVGLACRFPGGADDPDRYWRLLCDAVDATGEVPPERWDADAWYDADPDAPGKSYVRRAGYLASPIDRFDARFFRIAPREATSLDPQQRLLLELAWEALEDAGHAPDRLAGRRGGVFVGINTSDYSRLAAPGADALDAYAFTGNTFSVAAGRVSRFFGLQGPSLALDTACSSSLVAVHLACRSLRVDDCDLALAGGVHLMLAPHANVVLSRMRALAPDGRSKAFAAAADGYGRGEGGGIVVLKRLADARRDHDRVLAVVRGSSVNHDGASSGLTVPNGPAQEAVLRAALADAGVAARDVGYLEAHGTGTPLGDPIELEAAGRVLGAGRGDGDELLVGSVKTNLGHLEAAAGIASLIKAVLCIERGVIPPHLHLDAPSPAVDWHRLRLRVPTALEPWPAAEGGRVAGVSSFGMSGTNAHLVVAEALAGEAAGDEAATGRLELYTLSAPTAEALAALAGRHGAHLRERAGTGLADLAFTANAGRAHFAHRLAIVAADAETVAAALAAFAAGESPAGLKRGTVPGSERPSPAFVFPGGGKVVAGTGEETWRNQPLFREVLERCSAVSEDDLETPLQEALYGAAAARLADPVLARTTHFALCCAAAELWRSWGVEPAVVASAGDGGLAAAVTAGVLDLETAARLASAGDAETFERRLRAAAASPPRLRWTAAAGAGTSAAEVADVEHWLAAARGHGPQRLEAAIEALATDGYRLFVAMGGDEAAPEPGQGDRLWLPSPLADDERRRLLDGAAELWLRGAAVDFERFDGAPRRRVALPTYPFERQRYWLQTEARDETAADWLYEIAWRAAVEPEPAPPAGAERRDAERWLILSDRGGVGERLGEALAASGARVVTVTAGDGFRCLDADRFVIDPGSPGDLARLLEEAGRAGGGAWAGGVHLWGLDAPPADGLATAELSAHQAVAVGGALHLLQGWVRAGVADARLWLVTRGAVAVAAGEAPSPAAAPLWGLGRVAALEHPEALGGLVDLDPGTGGGVEELLAELSRTDGETQVAWRGGRRHVARLVRCRGARPAGRPAALRADRTYLVTGGLGSLGLEVADRLAGWGARHLALLGRSAPSAVARERIAALHDAGVQVTVVAADVADADELARGLAEIESRQPPLAGAVHAAGVLDDGVLLMQSWQRFRRVLAPKVEGAWNLHLATRGRELDFLVFFSSAAALTGSPGQSNYAAANAFLDALAEHRHAGGLPAASLGWGPWADVGMAARLAQRGERRSTPPGVSPIALDDGLRLLGGLLAGAPPRLGILPVAWGAFLAAFPPGTEPPLFAELAPPRSGTCAAAPVAGRSELLERLAALPAGERLEAMIGHVRGLLAEVLEVDRAKAPPADAGFLVLGLDSLMAVELRNRLGVSFGRVLPAALTFQFPHAAALAAHLVAELLPAAEDAGGAAAGEAKDGELVDLSEDALLDLLEDELALLDGAAGSRPGAGELGEGA